MGTTFIRATRGYMGFRVQGLGCFFPKIRGTFFERPYDPMTNTDYSIFGSILIGVPLFWETTEYGFAKACFDGIGSLKIVHGVTDIRSLCMPMGSLGSRKSCDLGLR